MVCHLIRRGPWCFHLPPALLLLDQVGAGPNGLRLQLRAPEPLLPAWRETRFSLVAQQLSGDQLSLEMQRRGRAFEEHQKASTTTVACSRLSLPSPTLVRDNNKPGSSRNLAG
jgi:hypothetical protein